MRKHEVQCTKVEKKGHVLNDIQREINETYIKAIANTLKRSNLSKEGQIYIIDQMLENIKNI